MFGRAANLTRRSQPAEGRQIPPSCRHLFSRDSIRPEKCDSMVFEVFAEHPSLQQRVRFVLESLPQQVQQDFLDDPRFSLAVDNYMPGVGWKLMVPSPGAGDDVTRCVVLRTNLGDCAEAFAF